MKERIIGAVVLVALAVLVVPVFLDGPAPAGDVVSERVPLPGQDAQETQTVVLERNRDEPVPALSTPAAGQAPVRAATAAPATSTTTNSTARGGGQPGTASGGDDAGTNEGEAARADEPAPATPVDREPPPVAAPAATGQTSPERAADPPAPAASATGMFAVQLGSFSNKANAEALAAELRKQGFAAFLSEVEAGSGQLHRVRVGPQKDRPAAEAMAARLATAGHAGQVVPHP